MILGIDQGTTGTTALLLSHKGKFLGSFTSAVPQHFPKPGWVEHDPQEIWQSVEKAVRGVLKRTQLSSNKISAIGLTNQRETVSLFQGSKALHRFIVWQDRRTAGWCDAHRHLENEIRLRAGIPLDPYFSASKILWLKNKISKASGDIRFRTIESFLFFKLTKEDVSEATNASRTSLYNLHTRSWDAALFSLYDIPMAWTPPVHPSEGFPFKTKGAGFLPDGIPVLACLGDQQAALFGQRGWRVGCGKITYGTGSFILLNVGDKPVLSENNLVSTLAIEWKNKNALYALEGSAFISGAWIQWLRDQLQMLKSSDESETLAKKVKDSGGVFVVPALSGLGAPFWKAHLRGAILGLTRGSNRFHIARASIEALAFQNRALIDAMTKDAKISETHWKVDGGAAKNNLLMQLQSNVLKTSLFRPHQMEATAMGAALLAAVSAGILSLHDIENMSQKETVFRPKTDEALQQNYQLWLNYVRNLPSSTPTT